MTTRTKRQPTADEQARAAARRERFRALCQQVAAMPEDQRAAIAAKHGPRKISGQPFSAFNSCLLLHQHSAPTLCAGFHDWRKAGRMVRKGESGLMIWVPTGTKTQSDDDTAAEAIDSTAQRPGFIINYVFDVTQTDSL